MNSPFIFVESLGQVVCNTCQVAVTKVNMERHLTDSRIHREASAADRRSWVAEHEGRTANEPARSAERPDGFPELRELRTVQGYQCEGCGARSGSQKQMRKHMVKVHDLRGRSGRRSAFQKAEKGNGWSIHFMQSVFGPKSPHHRYFIVTRTGLTPGERRGGNKPR